MANFKITATTTVAELKEQFHNEFGGILRVYQGRSEAPEDATLVSLGGKVGELECRASRTVGKFIEAFQSELGLKVKVYTKDNWVSVLDGITLATVREIPKNARKAQMEQYLAYQRDEEEEVTEEAKADEGEYILFVTNEGGDSVISKDGTFELVLEQGENKVYLDKYPTFRDGFQLKDRKYPDSNQITAIDFSHVSRMKLKDMRDMFRMTENIKELDLSNIDTSELEDYGYAFNGCGVEKLNLSGWDLSHFEYGVEDLVINAKNLSVVIAHGCNSETICGIKSAINKGVTVISDLDETTSSDYEDFTEDKFEEAKSNDDIIVIMEKLNVKNIEELYERVHGDDPNAIITCINGKFHYVGNAASGKDEFENEDINYDELYIIYDFPYELSELNFDNLENGIYLPETSYSYWNGDDEEMEWPEDVDACNVIAEALTGDVPNFLYGASFYPDKIFVCDGKIIAQCG